MCVTREYSITIGCIILGVGNLNINQEDESRGNPYLLIEITHQSRDRWRHGAENAEKTTLVRAELYYCKIMCF